MLYLRTASGSFINAATIVQLSPQRARDEITGWIATRDDGEIFALAAYYAIPGRIENLLDYMPAVEIQTPSEHGSGADLTCPSENCPVCMTP